MFVLKTKVLKLKAYLLSPYPLYFLVVVADKNRIR